MSKLIYCPLSDNNGQLTSQNKAWATAWAGGTLSAQVDGGMYVGQGSSGTPTVFEGLLEFDTSGIPDSATIESVTLKVYIDNIARTVDWDLRFYAANFGAALTTDDWLDPRTLSGETIVATKTITSSIANDVVYDIACEEAMKALINKTGVTQLRATTSRSVNGTTESSWNRIFIPAEYPVLVVAYSDPGAGDVDLEVPVSMLDGPSLANVSTSYTNPQYRTWLPFNADDYDGATYYFEVVAKTSAGLSALYELVDRSHGNHVLASITVPAGTTAFTRVRSAAFGMPGGGYSNLSIRIPQSASNYIFQVASARVIVVQENASKTRLQFPLLSYGGGTYNATASYGLAPSGGSYAREDAYYPPVKLERSSLATIAAGSPWSFEAVFANANAHTTYAELYNLTKGQQVVGSELTYTGSAAYYVLSADLADDADYLDSDDLLSVRIKTDGTAADVALCRAALYVRLTPISKVLLHRRVAKQQAAGTAALHCIEDRIVYDDTFASSTVGLEVWAQRAAAALFYADVDGCLTSSHADYATARAGSGVTLSTSSDNFVGQDYLSSKYTLYESLIQFPLGTTIPAGATIESVALSLYLNTDNSETDFTVDVYAYDFGTAEVGDWVSDFSGLTLVASLSTNGIGAAGHKEFVAAGSALNTAVAAGGNLRLLVVSSRQVAATAPDTVVNENVLFESQDYSGTTRDPRLSVVYSAPDVALYEDATNESGTAGTAVEDATADVGSAYELTRSGPLTLVHDRRYYGYRAATPSNVALGVARLIVGGVFMLWETSLQINAGAASTDDNDVTLTIAATANGNAPDEMCFSDDGATWGAWEAYALSRAYQLPAQSDEAAHVCTVYAKFKYGDSVSPVVNDAITLQVDWTYLSCRLNNGAEQTPTLGVELAIKAVSSADDDGVPTSYRIRENGGAWSGWFPYVVNGRRGWMKL